MSIEEEACRRGMELEESQSHEAHNYAEFLTGHKKRVRQLEEERLASERQHAIHATATSQMYQLVKTAVKDLAQGVLQKRMAEAVKRELELKEEELEKRVALEKEFQKKIELMAQAEVDRIVTSSVRLGVERVFLQLQEEARLQKMKEIRIEEMKQRLIKISETAALGVEDSLSIALSMVTDKAVAGERKSDVF